MSDVDSEGALSNDMTLNTPACLAVRAWLVENKGTVTQIMRGTGLGLSTVERAVGLLRKASEPQAKNVLAGKKGPPRGVQKVELAALRAAREADRKAAEYAERVQIVAAALASRTALEMAWGGQA